MLSVLRLEDEIPNANTVCEIFKFDPILTFPFNRDSPVTLRKLLIYKDDNTFTLSLISIEPDVNNVK